jgi:hypothetical protein
MKKFRNDFANYVEDTAFDVLKDDIYGIVYNVNKPDCVSIFFSPKVSLLVFIHLLHEIQNVFPINEMVRFEVEEDCIELKIKTSNINAFELDQGERI